MDIGSTPQTGSRPALLWDNGTAYDFFISQLVLTQPDRFGLRGAWARGVRSRMTDDDRLFIEETIGFIKVPLPWLYRLPAPKSAHQMLSALSGLPDLERLRNLTLIHETQPVVREILFDVASRGSWSEQDRLSIQETVTQSSTKSAAEIQQDIERSLRWWAEPAVFSEKVQKAFQAYYEAFFAEEELRIQPALEAALDRAQQLAQTLPLHDLLEELSQGISFEEEYSRPNLILVPSYWVSPLVIITHLDEAHDILVFGGRPAEDSLVPGEMVPDALFQSLKALADPTRLRILRYLAEEPLTPTELSRRLRLRPPTVIHHLNTLRLAGLVHLSLHKRGDRRYAARMNRVQAMYTQLRTFLGQDSK